MKKRFSFFVFLFFSVIFCVNCFAFENIKYCREDQRPDFSKYRYLGGGGVEYKPQKLTFLSNKGRRYKTVISSASKQPANFSGGYQVVTWGCGTDCHEFAIINKRNGSVYTLPGFDFVFGEMGDSSSRIDFRSDSRLLIINGSVNDGISGVFFFDWNGRSLFPICRKNKL